MSSEIRLVTAKDAPALLPLAVQCDGARDFYRRRGYGERSRFELLDKLLERGQ